MVESRRMLSGGRCTKQGACKDKTCNKCYKDVVIPKDKNLPNFGGLNKDSHILTMQGMNKEK